MRKTSMAKSKFIGWREKRIKASKAVTTSEPDKLLVHVHDIVREPSYKSAPCPWLVGFIVPA